MSQRDNGRRDSSQRSGRPSFSKNFGAKNSSRSGGRPSGGGGRRRGPGGGGSRGRKFKRLNLPPESFMHTGVALKEVKYDAPRTYSEFPLHEDLAKNIQNLGWENPTEIQDKTFEATT